jgi:tetratricopeptide (TPR) repeat protein
LLTESRVLVDYIGWTLLPNLNSLTFYHDDLAVSHGLLDPPTTLIAILALIGLLAVAIWQRKARPLFCLGVLWFFAGHSMTGTIIALELVFEHRNYFSSLGLLLAAASLLALEPGLRQASAKMLIASGFIIFFAFTTFLRAQEWSHPLRLAYSEALKRPDSPRAQYELARTLIQAAGSDETSPLIAESVKVLERSAFLPSSGIAPLQALIFVAGRSHRPIDPQWWQAILEKLRDYPPSQSDIDAIAFLLRCQSHGECPLQTQELLDVFTLALTKSNGNVYLKSAYSDFAFRQLGDRELAERMAREAIAARPQVPTYRANLVHLLIAMRQFDAAEKAIDELATLDRLGSLDTTVAALRAKVAAAKAAASQAQPQQMPTGPTNR